jgi:TolB-like protein/Tfp pilus assembly protein PilF
MQISRALKEHPRVHIRMGIHSGPVSGVVDVTGRSNLAGAGLNLAQRVMKCGDAGHILISKRVAEDLSEFDEWRPLLHDLGRCEVKHGVQVAVVNLWSDDVGNRQLPQKFQTFRKQRTRVRWAEVAAALLLLAGIVAAFVLVSKKSARSTSIAPEKSIAVLPFENLSEDKANAYFADGIQEEILSRLASIADLKVISRTSTQRYQSKPRNLAEIGKQLGVANIVEGSVQKAAGQVRVNVQLVNAQTDSHLWAETYDRKLTDIFGVESEIAKRIAESLQAKLTGHEEQALAVKPTNNPEAYDAYLRGLAFYARGAYSIDSLFKAIGFYERAVQLDPKFAIAWARLSRAHAFVYFFPLDATSARRDAARKSLENAQKLQPNSAETLLALGYYQYHVLRDYGPAKTTFERVSKMLPGSSEVPTALGAIARREGQWDQSIAYFEQALALDPRNVELLMEAAWTHTVLRQFPAALKLYDRALDITPTDPDVMASKASIYQAQGNLEEAAKLLSEVNAQTPSSTAFLIKITELRLERNLGEAIRLLQGRQTQFHFTSEFDKVVNQLWLTWIQRFNGDTAGAEVTAAQARNTLEPLCKDQPDNAFLVAALSMANAVLGEKEAALKEAERAIMLLPSIKDRLQGPAFEENLALIQMTVGENSRAISTLTRLLQTPYFGWIYVSGRTPVTPALLKLDPHWDPLRADPAFQKLCEEKQAVAPELVTQSAPPKSIAVLPFENLSEEKANAYFADGIQEEILTRLAKIADLKVISRTSTQKYKSSPDNLREIAQQLGVANILEGSVQKVADQVRVNVQLVNAQTDSHLWADTYDRKLTDIFGVESEIAKRIAESLQAKLTGHEEQALAVKPTNNPEAYDAYLRGLAFEARIVSNDVTRKAIDSYDRAVQLDPNFALAWARLSRADAGLYFEFGDTTAARRDAAKAALENAQKLQPNAPETQLALGYYQYFILRDYGLAKTTFGLVHKLLPGNSEVLEALGKLARRQGNWDESVAYLEQGLALDPSNFELLNNTAFTYAALRQFPTALKLYDRALDIIPNDLYPVAAKAGIYQAEGNLQEAAKSLSEVSAHTPPSLAFITKIIQLRLERNHGEAIRLLQAKQTQFRFTSEINKAENQLMLAWTQRLASDTAGAKASGEQARNTLEQLGRNEPDNANLAAELAMANAVLGEKTSALKEIQRATMLLPKSKDRVEGPSFEELLALIQMTIGENSRAISTLTQLLQAPYGTSWIYGAPVTPALLRLDPLWDPLRADPAFQKLCEKKQP